MSDDDSLNRARRAVIAAEHMLGAAKRFIERAEFDGRADPATIAAAERRGAEKAIRHAARLAQRSFTGEVHYEQLNEHADMIRDGEADPFEANQPKGDQ